MKVGIYLGWGSLRPEDGGGYTFQQSLLKVLGTVLTVHEWYIFYYGNKPCGFEHVNNITLIPITPSPATLIDRIWWRLKNYMLLRSYKSLLNKAALDNSIDMMWFMTPGYEYVEVPYVYTVWDLQHRRQSFFPEVSVERNQFEGREKRYASVIPRAAYILTGNQTAQQEVVHFYAMSVERVKMLELPTPIFAQEALSTSFSWPKHVPHKPYLFYPAQFWPHKNHVVILEALRYLDSDMQVVFTGSDKGNLAYVREYAEKLGIGHRVHFLGFVSCHELGALYQHAQALVFASLFGPNNLPPLEAFALSCPVICADVAGMREQLGKAALYFNATDEHDLVAKITYLVRDDETRKHFIAMGKERSLQWTARDYVAGVVMLLDEFSVLRRTWGKQHVYINYQKK